jgi:putative CocE/NonD family hydrolase
MTAHGYAVVVQDMRGLHDSEGEAMPFVDCGWGECRDGFDTVAWIVKQPWSDGKVGTFGGSAMGITQNMLAGAAPPNLEAQWIQVAANSLYHHAAYVGGAFRKSQVEQWTEGTGFPARALETMKKHSAYDEFWKLLDASTRTGQINVPAVHFGGWFDTFSQGTIDSFRTRQERGAPGAKGKQVLVMGPWTHGGRGRGSVGELRLPSNARRAPGIEMGEWFEHHLKGKENAAAKYPAVTYYVMGAFGEEDVRGNEWRTAEAWPPPFAPTALYLRGEGRLAYAKPDARSTFTSYDHKPVDPVPTVGGRNLVLPAGPFDQRKIEERDDVLVFTSEELQHPVESTGPVRVVLYASSSAVDTDFVARLCDVYPDGRSMLIADGIIRCRYRGSLEKAELLKPDEVVRLEIDLWDTSIVFNTGHRIRVSISSSNYPRFDVNPGSGKDSWEDRRPVSAKNTVYFDRERPSHLLLAFPKPAAKKRD